MAFIKSVLRNLLFLGIVVAGVAAAWYVLVSYPASTRELLGIVLILVFLPAVLLLASNIANSVLTRYNVGEISINGPITRERSSSPLAAAPVGTSADAMVEQIELADADSSVDALLVKLNTPGGEIVPSEDIKLAIERFDGPAIAYTTDTCASGGYEIASGCDEIWAREGSIVGSIGVIGSRVTAAEMADKLGLEYEQLTAGEYKDAGMPLKQLEEHERTYLQGLIDDYYDLFLQNISERRDIDTDELRETEARVFLGWRAAENGLVDEIGTRQDVEDRLEEAIGKPVSIREFKPHLGFAPRLQVASQRVAYAFGAGILGALRGEDNRFKFR